MRYLLHNQQTGRLLFKPIDEKYFSQWLKFFEDPTAHQYWVEEQGAPEYECNKWYEKQHQRYVKDRGGMNALIEKVSGRLVGHAGLLVQEVDGVTELEIAYSLLPEFWNKGYAIESARKCKEYGFENNFAESLISIISISNLPSQNVAIKNGLTIDKQTVYRQNEVYIYRIQSPIAGKT
ncbi:MAG: GNAT family N-acetyltransferase [Cyclobacteriaceae bacterium]|nr:MAG: GNAT family N-acetyltransferase [Cyclobacteriaceae bacterium]